MALVALLLVVVLFEYFLATRPFTAERPQSLTTLQKSELDLFSQRTNLLTSIATLGLGATGTLLLTRKGRKQHSSQSFLLAAFSFAASLYCGVTAQDMTLWLLSKGAFDLTTSLVSIPTRCQLWCLIVGSYFLFRFAESTVSGTILHNTSKE
jgi:hypothetical protein